MRKRISRIDVLLLLMTIIWGTNYSIVKHAFREMDPQAFNAVRMVIGSTVFLSIIFGLRRFGIVDDEARGVVAHTHSVAPLLRWVHERNGRRQDAHHTRSGRRSPVPHGRLAAELRRVRRGVRRRSAHAGAAECRS